MAFRIGQGLDVHRFCPGDHVMIAGVKVPHGQGVQAHSDGDVALHALCDALLGSLALGDIGHLFPDTDDRWAGADSAELLREVYQRVRAAGYRLVNADITVIAQAPKLAPHIAVMRERVASLLDVAADAVSIKATTSERLGFTGRGEGIAASAVVMVSNA
jgi:2-C-methyl-D-erythritol 2,4-cyclodiphosphate synthase